MTVTILKLRASYIYVLGEHRFENFNKCIARRYRLNQVTHIPLLAKKLNLVIFN